MSNKRAVKESAIYNKIAVITSREAWDITNKEKPKLKDCYTLIGKVEKKQPHIIRTAYKQADKATIRLRIKTIFAT